MAHYYDIMYNLVMTLNPFSMVLRVILAMVLGGILGAERSRLNRAAGMRTYMLVTLGAAMVMMTGEYTYHEYGVGDPARLGAQVVNGIGFLGAGSIIVQARTRIRGLTTAAGLWVAACIGLAIGIGFYSGSILATIAVWFIMAKFKSSNQTTQLGIDESGGLFIVCEEQHYVEDVFVEAQNLGVHIGDVSMKQIDDDGQCTLIVTAVFKPWIKEKDVVTRLKGMDGVQEVKFIPVGM